MSSCEADIPRTGRRNTFKNQLATLLRSRTHIAAEHPGKGAGGRLFWEGAVRDGVVIGEPNVMKCINKDVQPQHPGVSSNHETKVSLYVCITCQQRNCGGGGCT